MAAKRSPILGYNHNVRFRGIVFHIQTEDSGIVNPHVFSHLFHGGVILSTRKLVYDPGSNDEAVKSLMQAQHKAVMKDLRRGAFDDKIDSYLADAPGLLPRDFAEVAAAAAEAEAVTHALEVEAAHALEVEATHARAAVAATHALEAEALAELTAAVDGAADYDAPIELGPPSPRALTPSRIDPDAAIELLPFDTLRTIGRSPPSDTIPIELGPPTDTGPVMLSSSQEGPGSIELAPPQIPPPPRVLTPRSPAPRVTSPRIAAVRMPPPVPADASDDDSGEVSIEVVGTKPQAMIVDDVELFDATPVAAAGPIVATPRSRPHPTPATVGLPPELSRAPTLRAPEPLPLPVPAADHADHPDHAAVPDDADEGSFETASKGDVSAAMRSILLGEDGTIEALDEPAEIHAPALPSAPQPPGAAPERVGEYHLGRKSTVIESPPPSARPPIPRPTPIGSRLPTPSNPVPTSPAPSALRPTAPSTPTTRAPTQPSGRVPSMTPPRAATNFRGSPTPAPYPGTTRAPMIRPTPQGALPRALTPNRPTPAEGNSPARTPVQPPRRPATGGGVVVSRPAVIVGGRGAPTQPPAKVRRAKEPESFGGDLISERSLDEVILAYLSEDNSED